MTIQDSSSTVTSVSLHVGGYTSDQPQGSSGMARTTLGPDGFGSVEKVGDVPDPSWVVPGEGGRLFAISEDGDRVVMLDEAGQVLAETASGGMGPAHLSLSPDGCWLAVSNYVSGSLGLVRVDQDGDELELVQELSFEGEGPHERQDSSHAHQAVWLDDTRLLVCDLGADRVHEVSLQRGEQDGGEGSAAGELLHTGSIELPAGTGPRHLALHPGRDDLAWVVGELDLAVHVLHRDAGEDSDEQSRAGWRAGESWSSAPSGPADGETTAAGIAVSPDGGHVYVSTRGTDNVAVYAVGEDGALELAQLATVEHWPRFIGWVPGQEGEVLLVAAERGGSVQAYVIEGGLLGQVVGRLDWDGPTWVG